MREAFGAELSAYEVNKGTVRFALAERVPVELIAGIAQLLARDAAPSKPAAKARAKKARRKSAPVAAKARSTFAPKAP